VAFMDEGAQELSRSRRRHNNDLGAPCSRHSPMSSVLLKVLRIVHLARRYIGRTSSRWALFLAILGRKLSGWWHRGQWPGKPGPSKHAESSLPCTSHVGLSSSAPGGPAILKGHGVAASNVPASASQGSLGIHVGAEEQPATAPPSPIPATVSVEELYGPDPGPSDAISRSSSLSNVSFASDQSRASERLSRITASRKAQHTPVGEPAELPRSPHHQFGRRPDPERSGGRLSRSPSPMRPHTQQPHHLDVIQTVIPTHPHAGGRISPTDRLQGRVDMPSLPYNTQAQRTPLTHQKQKMMGPEVHVQSPSPESLPIPTHSRPLTEEPMAISPTQPSIASSVTGHHEIASQRPSFVASEYYLPDGRSLELIHSEEIPRYSKNITMQVDCAISFIQSLHMLTDPVRKYRTLWSP
jgi:hypothetical protein